MTSEFRVQTFRRSDLQSTDYSTSGSGQSGLGSRATGSHGATAGYVAVTADRSTAYSLLQQPTRSYRATARQLTQVAKVFTCPRDGELSTVVSIINLQPLFSRHLGVWL